MGGACRTYGGEARCIQRFDEETPGKETNWKTTSKWEENIKIDIREVGWGHGLD